MYVFKDDLLMFKQSWRRTTGTKQAGSRRSRIPYGSQALETTIEVQSDRQSTLAQRFAQPFYWACGPRGKGYRTFAPSLNKSPELVMQSLIDVHNGTLHELDGEKSNNLQERGKPHSVSLSNLDAIEFQCELVPNFHLQLAGPG